jgi:hypothetical protein
MFARCMSSASIKKRKFLFGSKLSKDDGSDCKAAVRFCINQERKLLYIKTIGFVKLDYNKSAFIWF